MKLRLHTGKSKYPFCVCIQTCKEGSKLFDIVLTETTAEPPVPEPSAFEVGMAIEKLKRHKAPGID
jgi:hypothetical protein